MARAETFADYLANQVWKAPDDESKPFSPPLEEIPASARPFTMEELNIVLRALGKRKASGPDAIPAELLQNAPYVFRLYLIDHYNCRIPEKLLYSWICSFRRNQGLLKRTLRSIAVFTKDQTASKVAKMLSACAWRRQSLQIRSCHVPLVTTDFFVRRRAVGVTMDNGEANPNLTDIPSETAERSSSSREAPRDEVQQVMGAQSAKAKATKAPVVLNGTYGSVGPMTLDDEVRQASSVLTGRDEAAGSEAGRTGQGSGVSSLRIAAGRVMATVAAKVQEVIPPAGKSGSTTSVLVQEDNGSAGTVGSGYVTAGSEPRRESRLNEDQEQADRNLFSPQQARRLQEMETEAPLLYAGDEGGTRPVSPSPQLPHSASSSSDQADAIQAEVRRQMQSYLVVQAELQQRVAVLVEENQLLRQVAVSSEVGAEAQGSQTAKGGWFSGIRKNIMGLVHQVPMKSAGVPLAIPEGWALNPPPTQGPQAAMMSTTIQPAGQNPSFLGLAPPPVAPASLASCKVHKA